MAKPFDCPHGIFGSKLRERILFKEWDVYLTYNGSRWTTARGSGLWCSSRAVTSGANGATIRNRSAGNLSLSARIQAALCAGGARLRVLPTQSA